MRPQKGDGGLKLALLNDLHKYKDAPYACSYYGKIQLPLLRRVLIALMENYQQADGSILILEVLQKYVGERVIR